MLNKGIQGCSGGNPNSLLQEKEEKLSGETELEAEDIEVFLKCDFG